MMFAMEARFYAPSLPIRVAESILINTPMTKAARVILDVVGAFAIGISLTVFSAVELDLLLGGILIIVITELFYFFLDCLGLIATDMNDRPFKPAQHNRSTLSYIEGTDMPLLTLDADTDYDTGFDHGYLVAPYLTKIISRIRKVSLFIGYLQPGALGNKLRAIKENLTESVRDELRGLIDGMHAWDKEKSWFHCCPLTEDELLLYQLLPDLLHFFVPPHLLQFGCATVVTPEMEVGRHLDWPSLGVFGKLSLPIYNKNKGYINFAIPGLLGVLTGIKKDGTFISMHVSPPRHLIEGLPEGLPSTFFCREVIEGSNIGDLTPLAPFNMIRVKQGKARSYHFLQGQEGDETVTRKLHRRALITLNHTHHSSTRADSDMFYGRKRKSNIRHHLHRGSSLATTMRSPFVNNPGTIQSIFYNPQTMHLRYNQSNSFSAASRMQEINLSQIFQPQN